MSDESSDLTKITFEESDMLMGYGEDGNAFVCVPAKTWVDRLVTAEAQAERLEKELHTANFHRDNLAGRLTEVETAVLELRSALWICSGDDHWREAISPRRSTRRFSVRSRHALCRQPKGRSGDAIHQRDDQTRIFAQHGRGCLATVIRSLIGAFPRGPDADAAERERDEAKRDWAQYVHEVEDEYRRAQGAMGRAEAAEDRVEELEAALRIIGYYNGPGETGNMGYEGHPAVLQRIARDALADGKEKT